MLDPTALKTAIDDFTTAGNALLTLKANPSTSTYDQVLAAYLAMPALVDAMRAEFDEFNNQQLPPASSLP